MRKLFLFVTLVWSGVAMTCVQAQDGGQIIVELGNAVTLGEFTYEDTTIDVSEEFFNPSGSIEYKFAGSPVALGAEFAISENDFDGEYDDGDGTLTAEREKLVAFVRFGDKNGSYLRLGYCNFKYDFSDAVIHMDGETDTDGQATGDLTTGADVEACLALGDRIQASFAIGASYFIDAEYDWSYIEIGGNSPGLQTGSAKMDAVSLRVRPEVSVALNDDLRLFLNATVQASSWLIDEDDDEESPDYVGVDIYSAVGAGIRYTFSM